MDRRRFVQTVAAAGIAAAVRADEPADPFGGFTIAIQSYTFREFKTLERALKKIQDAGVKNVELFRNHLPPTSSPDAIQAALRLCGDYGVKPVAFGVEGFSKNHDANKKLFDFGAALGIKSLSADPDPDSFDSLDKLCEEYKIAIAIHPHGPTGKDKLHRWYGSEVILPAVKDHHPLIGTCLDTGHLIRSEQLGKKLDPATEVRAMGARNFGMHLKDHDNTRRTDVVYGKGALDVPGVLKALREVNFKGYIAIEYEANPADPSDDVKACLEVFRDSVKKLG